jgi:acyl-CoA thioester hydrolase
MSSEKPFSTEAIVSPDWIDYNGHMNMGYYLVAFDHIATDRYFDFLGIGIDHKQAENKTTFSLAANIDFIREVLEGDSLRFETRMLDFDHKRIHYIHSMYHAEQGYLASTNECLTLYIDMATRRSTPFSDDLMQRFSHELELGQRAGKPATAGRTLGIRR